MILLSFINLPVLCYTSFHQTVKQNKATSTTIFMYIHILLQIQITGQVCVFYLWSSSNPALRICRIKDWVRRHKLTIFTSLHISLTVFLCGLYFWKWTTATVDKPMQRSSKTNSHCYCTILHDDQCKALIVMLIHNWKNIKWSFQAFWVIIHK